MSKGRISPPEEWTAQAIIDLINDGHLPPWTKSWSTKSNDLPRNLQRPDKPYNGLNYMLLIMVANIFDSPFFITPKQLYDMGGKKKDGERTWPVFFYKPIKKKDDNGEEIVIWLCKGYKVYNVNQTTGIEDKIPKLAEGETYEHDPIEVCEKIVNGYKDIPKIISGPQPLYNPVKDNVKIPAASKFKTRENYYATLFHELAHSTGHSSRLARDSMKKIANFGDHAYSEEELVAEFTSAMLCGKAEIEKVVIENQAAYIKHWSNKLEPKMIVYATRSAKKAFSYIVESEAEEESEEEDAV